MIPRRATLAAGGLLLAASLLPRAARAEFISAPDVVVFCDPAVAPSLRGIGADFRARTGVPVRVLPAPGTLLIELLARGTRNDVLVTVSAVMDQAAARSLIQPDSRIGDWRDKVVLAARNAVPNPQAIGPAAVRDALAGGRLAYIDRIAIDRMDGRAVLDRLGWADLAAGRLDGMPSGQEVAFAVASGADRLGLLHMSDLVGQRGLAVVGVPPIEAAPPAVFAAAIGHNVLSRHTVAFMAYLNGPEATSRLRSDGLEKTA